MTALTPAPATAAEAHTDSLTEPQDHAARPAGERAPREGGEDGAFLTLVNRLGPALAQAFTWMPGHVPASAWACHGPFVQWLIGAMRPRMVVELGVHHGFSFLAMLDALKAARLEGAAVAVGVDTWRGDALAGYYGEEVFADLSLKTAPYGRLAALKRATFEEAAAQFAPASIDLLHIDGAHDERSVRADVELYRPLLAADGVMMLHDVANRSEGFGVYTLWSELKAAYPTRTFTFPHGSGLGLIAPGQVPEGLRVLFEAGEEERRVLQMLFARLGAAMEAARFKADAHMLQAHARAVAVERDRLEVELTELRGAGAHAQMKERAREAADARAEAAEAEQKADKAEAARRDHLAARQNAEARLAKLEQDLNSTKARLAAADRLRARDQRELARLAEADRLRARDQRELARLARERDAARREKINREEAAQRHIANLEARIEGFLTSKSWRYTAPVRTLIERFSRK